jgi:hypothetical protein
MCVLEPRALARTTTELYPPLSPNRMLTTTRAARELLKLRLTLYGPYFLDICSARLYNRRHRERVYIYRFALISSACRCPRGLNNVLLKRVLETYV